MQLTVLLVYVRICYGTTPGELHIYKFTQASAVSLYASAIYETMHNRHLWAQSRQPDLCQGVITPSNLLARQSNSATLSVDFFTPSI